MTVQSLSGTPVHHTAYDVPQKKPVERKDSPPVKEKEHAEPPQQHQKKHAVDIKV